MTRCMGCGITLQCEDNEAKGYIKKEKINDAEYCEKCFKMIHYGKSNNIKNEIDTTKIIEDINNKKDPIIYIIDILNITNDAIEYLKSIKHNKKYVLLTKFDLLPKSVKEKKIINYFKDNFCNKCEVMCISSKNSHNIETFYNMLKKDKAKKVYVVGLTNAGKSSFINSLLLLNNMKPYITTSPIPNTTEAYLNINIGNIEFIDTPGIESNSIHNLLTDDMVLSIKPKKELKVKTFQIKSGYSVIVNELIRIDYLEGHINSFNFYMSDNLKYKKVRTNSHKELITLPNKILDLDGKKDIVINGLGFIKINKKGLIKIYTLDENLINIRNKMI